MTYISNKYQKVSWFLIASMIGIYIVTYTPVLSFIPSTIVTYRMIPAIWIGLVLLMHFRLPHRHGGGKKRLRGTVYLSAFNYGVVFIVINILAGFIEGFGKSPYNHSLKGILTNIIFIGSTLVGREWVRAYLVSTYEREKGNKAIYLIIGFMTLIGSNFWEIGDVEGIKGLTIFLAEQFLPELSENILATYLVLYGGPVASIIYIGMIEAFEWLSPILPNLDWLAKGVVGMAVPLVSLTLLSSQYLKLSKVIKCYKVKEESLWKWLPTAIVGVLIIWFTVGVFPIYPSAIATGSMEPMIMPGDVVLVKKIVDREGLEALEVGEVIQFKRGSILINHRIVEIIEQENGLKEYRTKGDNNSAIDSELVKMEDIKGTIEGVIPKIGWPTLILKSQNEAVLEEVEF